MSSIARPATRVSTGTACDRCRRQKQRCDPERPCSNCAKVGHGCFVTDSRPAKRVRTGTEESMSMRSGNHSSPSRDVDQQDRHRQRHRSRSQSRETFTIASPRSLRGDSSMMAEFAYSASAMAVTRKVLQSRDSQHSRPSYAIPDGGGEVRRHSIRPNLTVHDVIGVDLPPKAIVDSLIDVYFYTVHWFSLVVHETTFRERYERIMDLNTLSRSDRPFLLLLLMVLVMGCHYGRDIVHEDGGELDLDEVRSRYLKTVRSEFLDIGDDESLEFVQICILLGSYWLYWGKPRSSFALLGTAIKSAQALSLHRKASQRQPTDSSQNIEERKRVWWTIYTWDRFATVVYGRPLGINDRDCDINMPACFVEHIVDIHSHEVSDIELSPYQNNLNRIYSAVSPMLENIYSIRYPFKSEHAKMAHTLQQIDRSMYEWHQNLPTNMALDRWSDIDKHSPLEQKIHALQALSLHLTHLNLVIVVHRPMLATRQVQQQDHRGSGDRSAKTAHREAYEKSLQRCVDAALALSRLWQDKPELFLLASRTHLLSFLAMNIFTSSVVLFLCASSEVLSNTAQEAKRGLSRNLQMLRSLPHAGSLSKQCGDIVSDLIHLVLTAEKDEMFNVSAFQEIGRPASASCHDRVGTMLRSPPNIDPAQHKSATDSPQVSNEDTGMRYSVGMSVNLDRTMNQLNRVLKGASHGRREACAPSNNRQSSVIQDEGSEVVSYEDLVPMSSTWTPEQTAQVIVPEASYVPDMNQFWLWDFEQDNESFTDWSATFETGELEDTTSG